MRLKCLLKQRQIKLFYNKLFKSTQLICNCVVNIFLPWPTGRTRIIIARFRSGHIDFCNMQSKNTFFDKINTIYIR